MEKRTYLFLQQNIRLVAIIVVGLFGAAIGFGYYLGSHDKYTQQEVSSLLKQIRAEAVEHDSDNIIPVTNVPNDNLSFDGQEKGDSTPKKEKPDVPAEYKSALYTAVSYAQDMHMSKAGVYDQLTSEYGEKFSAAAAQYALDNVQADWKANALAKAKSYQDSMHMSPAAIRDQLTSSYGEKFTAKEADYAIQHLND